MSELKQSVALTSGNVEYLSRHDMLDWFNSIVHGNYGKIEELFPGKLRNVLETK